MCDESVLHYLPPEWTEERFQSAAEDDWRRRPEEELQKVIDCSTAESTANFASDLAELNDSRAARGTSPPQPSRHEEAAQQEGSESPLSGIHALVTVLERENWDQFGFVVFRTFYRNEALWDQFWEEYDSILRQELNSAGPDIDKENILNKVCMQIVSDDCMENKIPAHVAMAYRMFDDIEPGLKTKMCLIVDEECMRSAIEPGSQSMPFVKAVDVELGADIESAYPSVIKVSISSLLARFYPALANCDTVWEIVPQENEIWQGWPNCGDPGDG